MARRMIQITPGSESWQAWLAFYRRTGNKAELVMVACARRGESFGVWSEFPPEAPKAERVRKAPAKEVRLPERRGAVDMDVIAERLEKTAALDAEEGKARATSSRKQRKAGKAREAALEQVQTGKAPQLEGLADFGTRMAFDPYEIAEVAAGKRAPEKLKERIKIVNLRDDPIGQMAKRHQVDELHLDAARKWQALHDTAQIGGARGIDPTNMKVDGGRFSEPVSDMQRVCIQRLCQIDIYLGEVGAMLVRRVLGERMTIAKVAAIMGDTSALGIKRLGWRFREVLDTLKAKMGVVAEGRAPRMVHDDHSRNAAHADQPELHAAMRRAQAGR